MDDSKLWEELFTKRFSEMDNINDKYGYDNKLTKILLPEYMENNEEELERDLSYMKKLYPGIAQKITERVEDECDKLEYEGSLMFDEYPDKVSILKIVEQIFNSLDLDSTNDNQVNVQECIGCNAAPYGPGPVMPPPPYPYGNPLRDLINVIFCNEMYCRRNRYRRRRRRFY